MSFVSSISHKTDTLIIGAGLIGSSVAAQLGRLSGGSVSGAVRVLDMDLEGALSSSELNAGGVRGTFNSRPNILMSKLSLEYYDSVKDDVGYKACGYLWLVPPDKRVDTLKSQALQRACGWQVENFGPEDLKDRAPFIDKLEGIDFCSFAPKDGLINPNLLKLHYRKQAYHSGVEFEDRALVIGAQLDPISEYPVKLKVARWSRPMTPDQKYSLATVQSIPADKVEVWECKRVVNCAGAWAPRIAKFLGVACPSKPIRRQVCIFDCRDVDLSSYGMIVDTSGVYFHPEATNGLAGYANVGEPEGYRFEYDGEIFFQEFIWPKLYERSSAFERLKHLTGWAGLYEVSPDHSAVIGEVKGSDGRIFEAHSFSGHGAMHSYAAGLGLAEKMILGSYRSIDLTEFSGDRFASGGNLILEHRVI